MQGIEFKVDVELKNNYEKARKDLLQALKSFDELLPNQKEHLIKEIFGAANVAIVCNVLNNIGYKK